MSGRKVSMLCAILVLFMSMLACSMPGMSGAGEQTPSVAPVDQTLTAVSENVAVNLTQQVATVETPLIDITTTLTPTATVPPPTNTPVISPTITSTFTNTPLPCNWAQFVADVTVNDGSEYLPGAGFTKTWRLKNIGSCTWTPSYQLVFDSGTQMGAPAGVSINANVAPGATVDISVNLTAPASAGDYTGNFKLRAADNTIFGIGASKAGPFWVTIKVVNPTLPPPVVAKPDLRINQFSLTPANPVADEVTHVRLQVYNYGNAKATNYVVRWWGLESFASPSCEWFVDSTNPNGGDVLECDFVFQSPYNPKNTKAMADATNVVDESDEGNNVYLQVISVSD